MSLYALAKLIGNQRRTHLSLSERELTCVAYRSVLHGLAVIVAASPAAVEEDVIEHANIHKGLARQDLLAEGL